MKSNSGPTKKSEPDSESKPINSPEFRREALRELEDWLQKGHAKLAPGNEERNPTLLGESEDQRIAQEAALDSGRASAQLPKRALLDLSRQG